MAASKGALGSRFFNPIWSDGGPERFTRPFNDWELDQVCSFLSAIHVKRVIPEEKDGLV